MGAPASSFWNPEKMELLKKLWLDGLSAGNIATIMGVTRNAIIGKKSRLKLPKRPVDARRTNRKPIRAQQRFKHARVTIAPSFPVEITLDPLNKGVPLDGLRWNGGQPANCRAILHYDKGAAFYCGEPNRTGESFCPGHCKIYFNAPRNRAA